MNRRCIPALLMVLALVASACGDDDTAATTSEAVPATSGTSVGSTTLAPTTTAATVTTSSTTIPGSAPSTAIDLAGLAEVFARMPARLTYAMGDSVGATTLVLAQDPTGTPPIQSIQQPDEGLKIIISETAAILCNPGTGCFEIPGAAGSDGLVQGVLGPLIGSYLTLAEQTGSSIGDVETTAETIAGRAGVCFSFSPRDPIVTGGGTAFVRQCLDAELGFTLLVEAQEAGGDLLTVMRLVDYALPTADDFEPTGPVQTAPQP